MVRTKSRSRPRVLTRCVADTYAGPDERIIEFSHDNGGGLICFAPGPNGTLVVNVYRQDATVQVRVGTPGK